MRILVFNCGSSSLKFEVVELERTNRSRSAGAPSAKGIIEGIGTQQAKFTYRRGGAVAASGSAAHEGHEAAARHALQWLSSLEGGLVKTLDAAAHRIVHGGDSIAQPVIADDAVLAAIEQASVFAPLHNPPALGTIRAVARLLPGVPEIIAADTAFHQSLPPRASTYAIPKAVAARHGIRRYGFHGIGHSWMRDRYAELCGKPAAELDLITLQLGAGCSIAAIAKGNSVDTSMGLTPLEGLMMGTRSGDLDPAIPGFLQRQERISSQEVERMLNHDSGLLGVSGVSSDLPQVEEAAARGERDALLALEMFCYRVRKYIGAYLAALGRADAIVFSAGIGEHSASCRQRICEGLQALGIVLDRDRNRAAAGAEFRISADASKIEMWVIPMDEELQIARAAAQLLAGGAR